MRKKFETKVTIIECILLTIVIILLGIEIAFAMLGV